MSGSIRNVGNSRMNWSLTCCTRWGWLWACLQPAGCPGQTGPARRGTPGGAAPGMGRRACICREKDKNTPKGLLAHNLLKQKCHLNQRKNTILSSYFLVWSGKAAAGLQESTDGSEESIHTAFPGDCWEGFGLSWTETHHRHELSANTPSLGFSGILLLPFGPGDFAQTNHAC